MRVLFLCTGNSARSQMAEALLRQRAAERRRRIETASAGVEPKGLHPLTVEAMAEAGIDVSGAESKSLDRFLRDEWDLVVTVCDNAREACPVFPGARRTEHGGFPDPAEAAGSRDERLGAFRNVRDAIAERVSRFLDAPDGP